MQKQTMATACCALLLSLLLATAASAHVQWVQVMDEYSELGDTLEIRLGSGHAFPQSEMAEDPAETNAFVITSEGERVALPMMEAEEYLTADYAPAGRGYHVAGFEVDRGVISRTGDGWEEGGKSVWPDAEQSLNYYVSALAGFSVDGIHPTPELPLGLKFELHVRRTGGNVELTVYREGAPAAGVGLRVLGAQEEGWLDLGESDEQGRLTWTLPEDLAQPLLFSATWRNDEPESDDYDADLFRCNVFFSPGR